ncbi:MAG TPA: hypothetical protein VMC61_02710, partial [Methanocella sp.]|nr:hypothetical protein [Methanocella sp.]
ALDKDGNAYVTEYGNHRVQKFDPSGNFITQWGREGSGQGEFEYPAGIAVSGDGQFEYPAGIAVSGDGIVYVADLGNSRIEMFSSDGGYMSQWGSAGSGNGQFSLPHGIAVDGSGNVYVADLGNHRVQKFTSTGRFIGSFGSYGKKDGLFMSPAGVAVYQYTLLVTDIDRNNVQSFTTDGAFLNSRGSPGSGPGQFDGAAGIATDGWNVYVADMNNHRVQKSDLSGNISGFIDGYGLGAGQPPAPAAIAADRTGDIYVADSSNNNVQRLFYDPRRGDLVVQNRANITLTAPGVASPSSSGMGIMALSSGNGPTTYINLAGTAGNGSWYRSNVTVTLSPFAKSGTVISQTLYRLDNNPWVTYAGPFNLTDEGTTTVSYYSVDNLGNAEAVQSTNVRIDKTPPAVTGTMLTDPVAGGWYTGSVTVHFSANDTL